MADKAPSAWLIEKALAAWHTALQVSPDDSDIQPDTDSSVPDVKDILHRLIQSAVNAGDMAVMAAQREAEIKQRKDRYLAREQALRQVVQGLMETMGEKWAEFGDVSASLGKGRESVVITDADKLPPEYVKETALIRDATDAGIEAASEAVSAMPPGQMAWDKREFAIAAAAATAAATHILKDRTPIKADILADINQGVVIPGAEKSNGGTTLTIRTK